MIGVGPDAASAPSPEDATGCGRGQSDETALEVADGGRHGFIKQPSRAVWSGGEVIGILVGHEPSFP